MISLENWKTRKIGFRVHQYDHITLWLAKALMAIAIFFPCQVVTILYQS